MSLYHLVIHCHLSEPCVLGLKDTMIKTQSLPSRNLGSIEEGRQSESSMLSVHRGLHRELQNGGGGEGEKERRGFWSCVCVCAQRISQRRTPEMEQQVKTLWVSNIMKAQGTIHSSDLCG